MASSKTIDNMGMDVSNQYASADHLHASSLVQDARMVTTQAQKDQNIPSYSPELSLIFQTNEKNRPFAEIDSPQGYETTTNAAYLFSFIPSLGGKDKIEAMTHRIEHYIDQLKTSMGSVSDPKIINHAENQITQGENIHNLLQLITDRSDMKEYIETARRKNQKG